ncbi:hypothetical protein MTO96_020546 [Rhipicephalus appendiculatus]
MRCGYTPGMKPEAHCCVRIRVEPSSPTYFNINTSRSLNPFLTVTKLLLGATLPGEHLSEQPAKLTRSTAATEEAAGAAALQRLRRYLAPDHRPGTTHGSCDIPH